MMKKLGKAATIALVFLVLGFVSIALAWNGAANKDSIQEQFPYMISGAIAGVGFISVGLSLLLFEAGRRMSSDLAQRLDALTDAMQGARPATGQNGTAPKVEKTNEEPSANGRVVVGRNSFHRPDCRLVSSVGESTFATTEDAIEKGLQPCRVCDPTAAPPAKASSKK